MSGVSACFCGPWGVDVKACVLRVQNNRNEHICFILTDHDEVVVRTGENPVDRLQELIQPVVMRDSDSVDEICGNIELHS